MQKIRKYGLHIVTGVAILFFLLCVRIDKGEPAAGISEGREEEAGTVCHDGQSQNKDSRETAIKQKEAMAEIDYIPELGYGSMTMGGSGEYACWKDMLVLGDCIYREKDGVYYRADEETHDLFGLYDFMGQNKMPDGVKQYKNLLITRRVNTFLAYNMNTGTVRSYRCSRFVGDSDVKVDSCWYVYDGKLYYLLTVGEEDSGQAQEDGGAVTMIRCLDLRDGSEEVFFVPDEKEKIMRRQFMIRDDGTVITELINRENGHETELCRLDQQGNIISRTGIQYKESQGSRGTENWLAFNRAGLFVLNNMESGFGNTGVYCFRDDGSGMEIGIRETDRVIFTEYGYFQCRDMACYDFSGNQTSVCLPAVKQAETGMGGEAGSVSLRNVIFDGKRLTAFYEDIKSGVLQVCQMQVKVREGERDPGQRDVLQLAGEGKDVISVTSSQALGNLQGYRFEKERIGGEAYYMTYVRRPDFLFSEQAAGRGIYVSAHISEAESFLGGMLADLLIRRGQTAPEEAAYFSAYAAGQMEGWDRIIPDGWQPDLSRYDVSSESNSLYGEKGYDFLYVFHETADREIREGEQEWETEEEFSENDVEETEVRIRVTADGSGLIRGVEMRTEKRPAGYCSWGDRKNHLPDSTYGEQIVHSGVRQERTPVLNFEQFWRQMMDGERMRERIAAGLQGLAVSEDVAECAGQLEKILRETLDHRGEYIPEYRLLFSGWADYERFLSLDWDGLDDNWKADQGCDCYYLDETKEQDCVRFGYTFYPDFGSMAAEEAQAVIFDCEIDADGRIRNPDMVLTSVTEDERAEAAGGNDGRVWVIREGETVCAEDISVPAAQLPACPASFAGYEPDLSRTHGIRRKAIAVWGYENMAQAASCLGGRIKNGLDERNLHSQEMYALFAREEKAKAALQEMSWCLELAGSKWRAAEEYDCYVTEDGQREGCNHLRYYFYRYKSFEGKRRNLAVDVWLSERGIEDMQTCMVVNREA